MHFSLMSASLIYIITFIITITITIVIIITLISLERLWSGNFSGPATHLRTALMGRSTKYSTLELVKRVMYNTYNVYV